MGAITRKIIARGTVQETHTGNVNKWIIQEWVVFVSNWRAHGLSKRGQLIVAMGDPELSFFNRG